jgi:RHS repeat-associated protein
VRKKQILGIITSFSLLCLVLSSILLRAQHPLPPNPDFADALWVAQLSAINKIAAVDASALLQITDVKNVRAVAVDEEHAVLWAYIQNTLWAYRFNGEPSLSIPLTPHGDNGTSKAVAISTNPENGTVWLGVKTSLYHFGPHGEWLSVHTLPEHVRALSWDPTTSCLWVGTQKTIHALNDAGNFCKDIDPGPHPDIQDLGVEPDTGDLWVAMKTILQRYDASGILRFEVDIDKLAYLANDTRGGAWIATDKRLMRMDGTGLMLLDIELFDGRDKIVALVNDPTDSSVWVASKNKVGHIRSDGHLLQQLDLNGEIRDLALYTDLIPPGIAFTAPRDGVVLNTNTPAIEIQYQDSGSGTHLETLLLQANAGDLPVLCHYGDTEASCTPSGALPEGAVTLTATIQDYAGNTSPAAETRFIVDTTPPIITLSSPVDGTSTNQSVQSFVGSLNELATLTLNGMEVQVGTNRTFNHGPVSLQEGLNTFELIATDAVGNSHQLDVRVTLDTVPPAAVDKVSVEVSAVAEGQVHIRGQVGSAEPGARVTVTNTRTGQTVTVHAENDGSFTLVLAAQVGDVLSIVAVDAAGNASSPSPVAVGSAPPPDPTSVAPPLDRTAITDFATATAFLYSGGRAIQTGVALETIEPRLVGVLRGQVQTRDGTPLSGVTITIPKHPEYGQTLTRADGMFDMAVNGGGVLTVRYEKEHHLPVQRQVQVPWRDYAWVPEVVMVPYDDQVTTVGLSALTEVQAARGSVVTDVDGTRQATLLFAPGTRAAMVMSDGSTQPVDVLNVRATEYTVGARGPKAMPATLPATSAYTYAVELSIDEAITAGATAVYFTQPVAFYVENFLHFPTGADVPMGFYDGQRDAWVASQNGRVIKILGSTNRLAELDINGDDEPDDATALTALGVTDGERERLVSLYEPGQSLWRVPVTHFSAWDCNWGWGPPADATAPLLGALSFAGDEPLDDCTCESGSIIKTENQTLGEAVGILGTSLRLHYQSDRVPGYKAANTLEIPLSSTSIPPGLRRIELEIDVAGQHFAQTFPAAPDQRVTFVWDGLDGYGRPLQSAQPIAVRVGYTYQGAYQQIQRFGYMGNGIPISGSRTRQEVTLWQAWQSTIGPWDARLQNFGAWSLNIHHAYDPVSQVLHLGDGGRRTAKTLGYAITTVAGDGTIGASGDGGPATQAQLNAPARVAVGPDGSLYIADSANHRIRRVAHDGIITTVAGNGSYGYSGDNGPATQAQLNGPLGIAVGSDGSLHIADSSNDRIRRVSPAGIITTMAGGGPYRYVGDGGPATQAYLQYPQGLAVGPDSSLYIADYFNDRVRRIGPDGIITTVAGTGTSGSSGDGGPATQARIDGPMAVAVGSDGSLYIADSGNDCIRRVGPDGIITTVAGIGFSGFSGDGGPATQAQFDYPVGVAVDSAGSLYIVDSDNNRIRQVRPDGIIITLAGNGTSGFSGDGGPALQAQFDYPYGVAAGPDSKLYIADPYNARVRRVELPSVDFSLDDIALPSGDGSEVYVFDRNGRHLRTMDALMGVTHYLFSYDSSGRLAGVSDTDGNVTTIERDAIGNPVAIVAPLGQRTTLILGDDDYLIGVKTPIGESIRLAYSVDGLLTNLTDPRGNAYRYRYNTSGRLTRDEDPVGGYKELVRSEWSGAFDVTLTTALGRATTYRVAEFPTGVKHRVIISPNGLQEEHWIGTNGSRVTTLADGTVQNLLLGPDPRFGMQSPLATQVELRTPAGRIANLMTSRSITLADSHNPLTLLTQTDAATINGRIYSSTFDALQRTLISRTPTGRQRVSMLDARGRVVEQQVAGIDPLRFTYDSLGRPGSVTQGSRTSALAYDAQGNLARITDALSRVAAFEYDLGGRLTRQILPDGREILYRYDANGNLISITPPGRPTHTFTYTAVDLEEAYSPPDIDASAHVTQYVYNLDRQLVQMARPDGTTIDLGYDNPGRLRTMTHAHGQLSFSYHPTAGNLATITAPDGGTVTYGYDGSLLTNETWSGAIFGSIQYVYDNDFRPISQSVNGETPIPFQYDLDSLVIGVGALAIERDSQNGLIIGSILGNIADRRTYDSVGSLSSYRATFDGSDIFAVQYTRDLVGRIAQKTETVDGQTHTSSYVYDAAGRLIEVQRDGNTIATYAHDSNGNRLRYSSPDPTLVGTYDVQDRLTEYGPTTYTYTANGELQRKTKGVEITSYEYDTVGNLRAVTLPNGTQIEYVIDGRNRRIGKKVNGTLVQGFLYEGGLRPIVELDGSGRVTARFIYGTRTNVPEYMLKGGRTYRLVTDHLGSPRIVIDTATGHIVQRIAYDPFGHVTLDDNPGFQPFGFAGGVYDPDTRLTRFGARDYDAETGRWTAKDPLRFAGGDTNLYGYVLNDPVNWVDPAGLEQIRNGIIYDDDGNLTSEVGLAAPNLFFDPIDYVAGGLVGLVKGSAAKIAGACLSGSGGAGNVFERVMSNAELEATLKTGLLRGGRQGENFFTNSAALDARRAHQRLGLDGPLRDVRVRFEIQNDVKIYGPQPAKAGNTGTPGGGVEFYTTEPTVIKIIRTDLLRK